MAENISNGIPEWRRKIMAEQAAKAASIPEWRRRIMEEQALKAQAAGVDIFGETPVGPDLGNIDDSEDAPAMIRMAVGALEKDSDRLNTLRKFFPDAVPHGDGNFAYTNPETRKTNLYNQEGWIPSLGDIASITPEIAETIGGIGGAAGGAIGGGAAGSVVPVLGTGAGAVGGAIAGAGAGSAGARDLTQRALNWYFDNEDTRTGKEQAIDAAKTFALGAAGEGVGRGIGYGLKAGKNAWNRRIIGEIDEAPEIASRAADYRAIGVDPTVGMATGSERTARLEHALIPTRTGKVIDDRINQAFQAQGDEFSRIVGGISDKPLSIAEAGAALREQAEAAKNATWKRTQDLYAAVDDKVTSPAKVDATADFLKNLQLERAGYGEFDKLARGASTDSVIQKAGAIVADAQNGISFDKLKEARGIIWNMADAETDKTVKGQLDGLYRSLTADMESTAAANGPDALQSYKKANNAYRRYKADDGGFGKKSVANTLLDPKKDSDSLLSWAVANAKNGGNRIAQARRTVERAEGGKEAWNQTVAGFTERLGINAHDDFDPGLFMRNWSKISPEAKDALYKGTTNGQYKSDLDRLSRIADNYTKYRKSANHSNSQAHKSSLESIDPLNKDNLLTTALGTAGTLASGGAMAGALAAGAASGAVKGATKGAFRASRVKLLTSPETVNWLANIPQAEMRKGGIKQHLKNLVTLRNRTANQALATAINEYLFDVGYDENQN